MTSIDQISENLEPAVLYPQKCSGKAVLSKISGGGGGGNAALNRSFFANATIKC